MYSNFDVHAVYSSSMLQDAVTVAQSRFLATSTPYKPMSLHAIKEDLSLEIHEGDRLDSAPKSETETHSRPRPLLVKAARKQIKISGVSQCETQDHEIADENGKKT